MTTKIIKYDFHTVITKQQILETFSHTINVG